ncbi:MAG: phage late control D family protein [Fusobacteriaceae bacterium]
MKILPLGEGEIARRGKLVIVYETKDITADIAGMILSCTYRDSINEFDTIELSIEDRDGVWIGAWAPQKGEKITIKYILQNWNSKMILEHNLGEFYIDNIDYSGPPAVVSLKGVSVDISSNIMDEKEQRSWESVTLQKVAEDIAKKRGLELECDITFNRAYNRVEQRLESDYTLLKRLCRDAGVTIKLYSNRIILFEEEEYENKTSRISFSKLDTTNYSFNIDDTDTYSGCKISYYDHILDKKIEHTFSTKQRAGYKKNTQRLLFLNYDADVPGETQSQKKEYLLKIAQKELRDKNKTETSCSLSIPGQEVQISAGDIITIYSFGRFDGNYIVTEITTDYSEYSHSLSLRKCLEGY